MDTNVVGEVAAALADGTGGPGHIASAQRILDAVDAMQNHLEAMENASAGALNGYVEMTEIFRDHRDRVVSAARDLVRELRNA